MTEIQNSKRLSSSKAKPVHHLEERTLQLAKNEIISKFDGLVKSPRRADFKISHSIISIDYEV
jgi:hypothetical protein